MEFLYGAIMFFMFLYYRKKNRVLKKENEELKEDLELQSVRPLKSITCELPYVYTVVDGIISKHKIDYMLISDNTVKFKVGSDTNEIQFTQIDMVRKYMLDDYEQNFLQNPYNFVVGSYEICTNIIYQFIEFETGKYFFDKERAIAAAEAYYEKMVEHNSKIFIEDRIKIEN